MAHERLNNGRWEQPTSDQPLRVSVRAGAAPQPGPQPGLGAGAHAGTGAVQPCAVFQVGSHVHTHAGSGLHVVVVDALAGAAPPHHARFDIFGPTGGATPTGGEAGKARSASAERGAAADFLGGPSVAPGSIVAVAVVGVADAAGAASPRLDAHSPLVKVLGRRLGYRVTGISPSTNYAAVLCCADPLSQGQPHAKAQGGTPEVGRGTVTVPQPPPPTTTGADVDKDDNQALHEVGRGGVAKEASVTSPPACARAAVRVCTASQVVAVLHHASHEVWKAPSAGAASSSRHFTDVSVDPTIWRCSATPSDAGVALSRRTSVHGAADKAASASSCVAVVDTAHGVWQRFVVRHVRTTALLGAAFQATTGLLAVSFVNTGASTVSTTFVFDTQRAGRWAPVAARRDDGKKLVCMQWLGGCDPQDIRYGTLALVTTAVGVSGGSHPAGDSTDDEGSPSSAGGTSLCLWRTALRPTDAVHIPVDEPDIVEHLAGSGAADTSAFTVHASPSLDTVVLAYEGGAQVTSFVGETVQRWSVPPGSGITGRPVLIQLRAQCALVALQTGNDGKVRLYWQPDMLGRTQGGRAWSPVDVENGSGGEGGDVGNMHSAVGLHLPHPFVVAVATTRCTRLFRLTHSVAASDNSSGKCRKLPGLSAGGGGAAVYCGE